mmetsp:Transcript_64157/g.184279  ORF Transcript_64157/g.184279 Transcript_64157/m.184279 type:complete len:258 (-) Transcript_64157:33-806(-)
MLRVVRSAPRHHRQGWDTARQVPLVSALAHRAPGRRRELGDVRQSARHWKALRPRGRACHRRRRSHGGRPEPHGTRAGAHVARGRALASAQLRGDVVGRGQRAAAHGADVVKHCAAHRACRCHGVPLLCRLASTSNVGHCLANQHPAEVRQLLRGIRRQSLRAVRALRCLAPILHVVERVSIQPRRAITNRTSSFARDAGERRQGLRARQGAAPPRARAGVAGAWRGARRSPRGGLATLGGGRRRRRRPGRGRRGTG